MGESFIRTWDAVPLNVCQQIIDIHLANPDRRPGLVGITGEVREKVKKSIDTTYFVANNLPSPFIQALCSTSECLHDYLSTFSDADKVEPFAIVEGINVQQYEPGGGFFARHFERSSKYDAFRHLVFMIFLNTVTDGGGTFFPNQNVTVEAVAGRVVIWPSDWTHAHQGVISPTQEKFIMTGWYSYL